MDEEKLNALQMISIHTLAWRVTLAVFRVAPEIYYFNPHPRVEGDKLGYRVPSLYVDFNPHPRVEGDRVSFRRSNISQRFQSTPSRGG